MFWPHQEVASIVPIVRGVTGIDSPGTSGACGLATSDGVQSYPSFFISFVMTLNVTVT